MAKAWHETMMIVASIKKGW